MGADCDCPGQICSEAWGNPNGEQWKYVSTTGISKIVIRHGGVIDSIMFKSKGSSAHSARIGGKGGDRTSELEFVFPSEFLTGISGSYGHNHFGNNVLSLKIRTNLAEYGPFGAGQGKGTPFAFTARDGMITGFHGRAGRYLDAIGVYIAPVCSHSAQLVMKKHAGADPGCRYLPPPRSAAPWGGKGGREWDDGVFSAVKAVHARVRVDTGVLCAVRFTYRKEDGSEYTSPLHGRSCGGETHGRTIVIGDDEFLIGVEGFHGADGIKSVTFITNQGKYGPLGVEEGTYFCSVDFVDCKRKVVVFHGRSGANLDALGLHTIYS